jgi:hypothetical protein
MEQILKKDQKANISYSVDPHFGPSQVEIKIDNKKMQNVPRHFEMILGKYMDLRYTAYPGKPKGAEQRIFSNANSPVYEGVARNLGYKPLRGFQHP